MILTLLLSYGIPALFLLFVYLASVAVDLSISWMDKPTPEQVRSNIAKIIFWPLMAVYHIVMGGVRVIKHLVSDL